MSNPQVELHIAGKGVILIELDAEKAPLSTENFFALREQRSLRQHHFSPRHSKLHDSRRRL